MRSINIFMSGMLVAFLAVSCNKDTVANNQEDDISVISVSSPLSFASAHDFREAMQGNDENGLSTRAGGDGFTSFAETIMAEDDYDAQPDAILSARFGSLLNQDGEVVVGGYLVKVSSFGVFYAPVSQSDELRELLLTGEDVLPLCDVKADSHEVSDVDALYHVSGHSGICLYDTFGLLSSADEDDAVYMVGTRSDCMGTGMNLYYKDSKNLFGGMEPAADWSQTFTVPKSGDQKVKFSNSHFCNDTKIYHQNYGIASDSGIKTKTMKKSVGWNKFSNPIEAGIVSVVIREEGSFSGCVGTSFDINKVELHGRTFTMATVSARGKTEDYVSGLSNSKVCSDIASAEKSASDLGYSVSVNAIRYVIDSGVAIIRIPDDITAKEDKKIEKSWGFSFGGTSASFASLIDAGVIRKSSGHYIVMSAKLYGLSKRNGETRGSTMIYSYIPYDD